MTTHTLSIPSVWDNAWVHNGQKKRDVLYGQPQSQTPPTLITLHPHQSKTPHSPITHPTLTNHTLQSHQSHISQAHYLLWLLSWTDEAILGHDRVIFHTTLQRIFTIPRLCLWPLLLLFSLLPQISLSHL